jgi:hypothetical protein
MVRAGAYELGEYLDVICPAEPDEIATLLNQALRVPAEAWERTHYFPWIRLEYGVEVVVDYGAEGPGTVRLAVTDNHGDPVQRHAVAEQLAQAITGPAGCCGAPVTACQPNSASSVRVGSIQALEPRW